MSAFVIVTTRAVDEWTLVVAAANRGHTLHAKAEDLPVSKSNGWTRRTQHTHELGLAAARVDRGEAAAGDGLVRDGGGAGR